jgi:D-3-phosphoglycerate dehydrogenase
MKTKVLLTDKIAPRAQELLQKAGFETESLPTMPREQLSGCLDHYQAIAIRSATRLDAKMIAGLQNLRLIVRGGVGVDNIDIATATKAGIAVANTPGANTIATAELTFALMLALARNVVPAHNSVLRGEWQRATYRGVELSKKNLGLLGFGRIGKEVAKRALIFGMRVLAYDPFLAPDVFNNTGVTQATFDTVLQNADFLSLHLPLDETTGNILSASTISQLKAGVRIINCARGGLIDENAAAIALKNGTIAGLAVDVYEKEPPGSENPLIGLPGVIHVPHLGAYSLEAQAKVAGEVVQVIIDFFLKQKFDAVLNRKELF